jgi:orotate phosphoribosyltransferase
VVAVATIVERGAAPRMAEEGLDYRSAFTLQDLGL